MSEIIYLGADHAGFALKESLKKVLAKSFSVTDLGAHKFQKNDDYPDIAAKVARTAVKDKIKGILICGSAEGMCIAANKIKGIRAVAVWTLENARLSREHNDANVLCLSGWQLAPKMAAKIARTWLNTPFSSEARHKRRITKIARLEK